MLGAIDSLRSTVEAQANHQCRLVDLHHQDDADVGRRVSRAETRLEAAAFEWESLQSLVRKGAGAWNKAAENTMTWEKAAKGLVEVSGAARRSVRALDHKLESSAQRWREMTAAEASERMFRDKELADALERMRRDHTDGVDALRATLVSQNGVNTAALRVSKDLQGRLDELERRFPERAGREEPAAENPDAAKGGAPGSVGRLGIGELDGEAGHVQHGSALEQLFHKSSELEDRLSAQRNDIEGLEATVGALSARILQLEAEAARRPRPWASEHTGSQPPLYAHADINDLPDLKSEMP